MGWVRELYPPAHQLLNTVIAILWIECDESGSWRKPSSQVKIDVNSVFEVGGVIDGHYASLAAQGVQHEFFPDGHISN